jgi:hypothetical protein
MIEIEVKDATERLKALSNELSQRQLAKCFVRALNYAAARTNTLAKREVRKRYNIPNYNLDKTTSVKSANTTTLTAGVAADRGTLSLSAFNPTSVQMGKGGIRTELKRVGGRKGGVSTSLISSQVGQATGVNIEIIKGQKETLPGAFMGFWNNKSGASGGAVFARGKYGSSGFEFEKGHGTISKLKTKSVYWAILNENVGKNTIDNGMEVYEKRLLHEINTGFQYSGAK